MLNCMQIVLPWNSTPGTFTTIVLLNILKKLHLHNVSADKRKSLVFENDNEMKMMNAFLFFNTKTNLLNMNRIQNKTTNIRLNT